MKWEVGQKVAVGGECQRLGMHSIDTVAGVTPRTVKLRNHGSFSLKTGYGYGTLRMIKPFDQDAYDADRAAMIAEEEEIKTRRADDNERINIKILVSMAISDASMEQARKIKASVQAIMESAE